MKIGHIMPAIFIARDVQTMRDSDKFSREFDFNEKAVSVRN